MAATSKPPRLRESPRLLRGHHYTHAGVRALISPAGTRPASSRWPPVAAPRCPSAIAETQAAAESEPELPRRKLGRT
jgi:hypothetical protein